jgi:hypothetical protein
MIGAITAGLLSVGVTPPVLPTANMFARYDASNAGSITLSGSNVTAWNDISGNSRHAAQVVSTAQPTLATASLNGLNTITFDGNSDFFNVVNTTVLSNNFTVYAVVKSNWTAAGTTSGTTIIGGADSAFTWYINKSDSRLSLDKTLQASMLMSSNILPSGDVNVWRQTDLTWSGTYSGTQRWNKAAMGSFNRSGFAPTAAFNTIARYTATAADYFMNGSIAEIIIYSTAHDSTTTDTVEAYLTYKWGV